jgi:hypothetical protein
VVAGQGIFARYLIPLLLPLLAGLLATAPSRRPGRRLGRARVGAGLAGLAGMLALSWTITASTLAYDAARWHAADALVARGVPATDVDAGLEWVGYHAGGPARQHLDNPAAITWYARMFAGVRDCYLVSADPPIGQPAESVYPYRSYAVAGDGRLWVTHLRWCVRRS